MENQIKDIISGKIFIYPTDTIYGIGCNALNEESVKKIKELKGRDKDKPLSIIAPSKEWIIENTKTEREFIDKYLPGPYTLIVEKKDPDFLKEASPSETIGVRIPNHSFTLLIKQAEVPFITTSVNLSGEKPITSIKEIDQNILDKVDSIVDDGILSGNPSTIILPNGEELKRS